MTTVLVCVAFCSLALSLIRFLFLEALDLTFGRRKKLTLFKPNEIHSIYTQLKTSSNYNLESLLFFLSISMDSSRVLSFMSSCRNKIYCTNQNVYDEDDQKMNKNGKKTIHRCIQRESHVFINLVGMSQELDK